MRIEKINENQIKCILTREDLASRQIKLSELAYGSEKTRSLFRDMMEQAQADLGFEAGDIPLMIEAIPLSHEKIALIITKVESPDELDTRFSHFTGQGTEIGQTDMPADEDEADEACQGNPVTDIMAFLEKLRGEEEPSGSRNAERPAVSATFLYTFKDIEEAIDASRRVSPVYTGISRLYKDERRGMYHLLIKQGDCISGDFARVNNLLCSCLTPENCTPAIILHIQEHMKTILENNAVQTLARLQTE